jgi:high-affinity nickel-transport protein
MDTVWIIGLMLGMRHGVEPDHLAAIDGLTRLRPRPSNGVFFALGHGLVVMLLAVGFGHLLAERFAFIGPWTLIGIGAINLWRLCFGGKQKPAAARPVVAQPFLLGMLLAAGFETASQLSALMIAGQNNAWVVGAAFTAGMVMVDGVDGYLASTTQRLAIDGKPNARSASRVLGILVVSSPSVWAVPDSPESKWIAMHFPSGWHSLSLCWAFESGRVQAQKKNTH